MTRKRFQNFSIPFFFWIMTECRNAVTVNQGMREAFSTGSHDQYPPQPSSTYAHWAPRRIPAPRKNHEKMVQRLMAVIHASSRRPARRDAMAKAKGMARPTYPIKRAGG